MQPRFNPDPLKPMSMFDHRPSIDELAEKHGELFQLMHHDSTPRGLRNIAEALVLLAGYYFRRAEETESDQLLELPPQAGGDWRNR